MDLGRFTNTYYETGNMVLQSRSKKGNLPGVRAPLIKIYSILLPKNKRFSVTWWDWMRVNCWGGLGWRVCVDGVFWVLVVWWAVLGILVGHFVCMSVYVVLSELLQWYKYLQHHHYHHISTWTKPSSPMLSISFFWLHLKPGRFTEIDLSDT